MANRPPTVIELAEWQSNAVGTIHAWFTGYTEPWESDGKQRHVKVTGYTDDGLTFRYATMDGTPMSTGDYSSNPHLRIRVTVEEVREEGHG